MKSRPNDNQQNQRVDQQIAAPNSAVARSFLIGRSADPRQCPVLFQREATERLRKWTRWRNMSSSEAPKDSGVQMWAWPYAPPSWMEQTIQPRLPPPLVPTKIRLDFPVLQPTEDSIEWKTI